MPSTTARSRLCRQQCVEMAGLRPSVRGLCTARRGRCTAPLATGDLAFRCCAWIQFATPWKRSAISPIPTRPAAPGEVVSVHRCRQCILGWFSWEPERCSGGLTRLDCWRSPSWLMARQFSPPDRSCGLACALATSLRQHPQAPTSEDAADRACRSIASMRERFREQALARRRSGIVVLALIDLDGFRARSTRSWRRAGGDALMKSIAERLRSRACRKARCSAVSRTTTLLGRHDRRRRPLRAGRCSPRTSCCALPRPIFKEDRIRRGGCRHRHSRRAPADASRPPRNWSRRAGIWLLRAAKREAPRAVRSASSPASRSSDVGKRHSSGASSAAIASRALEVHLPAGQYGAAGGWHRRPRRRARWTHPTQQGAIAPSVFIPLAEQSGMMIANSRRIRLYAGRRRRWRALAEPVDRASTCRRCGNRWTAGWSTWSARSWPR